MRIRTLAAAALALPLIVFSAAAAHAEPAQGGCQQFGKHVSGLAQSLGAEFGGTARSVASSVPGAYQSSSWCLCRKLSAEKHRGTRLLPGGHSRSPVEKLAPGFLSETR